MLKCLSIDLQRDDGGSSSNSKSGSNTVVCKTHGATELDVLAVGSWAVEMLIPGKFEFESHSGIVCVDFVKW